MNVYARSYSQTYKTAAKWAYILYIYIKNLNICNKDNDASKNAKQ